MQLHGLMYVVSTLGRRSRSVRVKAPRSVSTTSSRIDSNQTLENTSRLVENIQWFHNYTCWNGGIGFGIWQPGNEAQQLSVFCRNCWLLLFNLARQQTANRHRTPLTAAEVDNLNIFSRWKQITFILLVSACWVFTFLWSSVVFNEPGSTDSDATLLIWCQNVTDWFTVRNEEWSHIHR